jgi:hypothetical protein
MPSTSDAHRRALEARTRMLDVRNDDVVPPLPESRTPDNAICEQYFLTASQLYGLAATAYAQGDEVNGRVYELYAYQHLSLGQACEDQFDDV